MALLAISSALCIMVEFKIIEIPNLIIYTEILGLYILSFIIKLYTTIKIDSKDIPWAVASIYVISFLISFQEFRIYNETVLVSFISAFFLGIAGVAISVFLCLRAEKLKKTF